MGTGHKKVRPYAQPVRKSPVDTGAVGGSQAAIRPGVREKPRGCPDQVAVTGRAGEAPTVGQPASLTLAGDRPQLVVAGRVAEIVDMRPARARVTRCLEEGESYLGEVTLVFPDRFEVMLTRAQ